MINGFNFDEGCWIPYKRQLDQAYQKNDQKQEEKNKPANSHEIGLYL